MCQRKKCIVVMFVLARLSLIFIRERIKCGLVKVIHCSLARLLKLACQLLTDFQSVRTSLSLPFGGQLTTDTYDVKLAHMLNNSISCLCICRNPLLKWKTTSTSNLFIMDCGIRTNRKWNYDDNSISCLYICHNPL